MAERKPISKKLRFEVFKRDGFKCQYCGQSAPDVILEVDHIVPVAEGGDNNIMNLITSCRDCNRGKGKRELSDDALLKKQKADLEELNERREQMTMMMKWREELMNIAQQEVDFVSSCLYTMTGHECSDGDKRSIRAFINEFGFDEVVVAAQISFTKYYSDYYEDTKDEWGWKYAIKKIGGICYNRKHGIKGKEK